MRALAVPYTRSPGERDTLVTLTLRLSILVGLLSMVACGSVPGEQSQVVYEPQFTESGELLLPPDELWRQWPQVGTPLTPNALNGGEAPFPEFHSVYIDPISWDHWRRTGEFRQGTVLVKELVSVYDVDGLDDGSTVQVSGRGYFMGEFIGFEMAYKNAARYPDEPGNWAYFTFGHHPQPYAASAAPAPTASCNTCHQTSAAQDYVFTQFYPVLRASRPSQ